MKKQKLHITFYNPNTEEETMKHLSSILAEVALTKLASSSFILADRQEASVS